MRLMIQTIPGPNDATVFVWLEAVGVTETHLLNLHQAPAIAAVLGTDRVPLHRDTAMFGPVIDQADVPLLIQRLRQAAAETEVTWRRYDPSASVEVVELPLAPAT